MGNCHYCMNCGRCRGEKPPAILVRRCPSCGCINDPGTRACAACGGSLERLAAASAADRADSIELSYDVVGGFDANALRVFWKVREAGCEPRWFALKAFTGMQLKYVLPGKRAPIVFALGDEDAYAYCDEDPCVGCTFRCKRGFELYAYVEKIGLVAQSVHREAVTR